MVSTERFITLLAGVFKARLTGLGQVVKLSKPLCSPVCCRSACWVSSVKAALKYKESGCCAWFLLLALNCALKLLVQKGVQTDRQELFQPLGE